MQFVIYPEGGRNLTPNALKHTCGPSIRSRELFALHVDLIPINYHDDLSNDFEQFKNSPQIHRLFDYFKHTDDPDFVYFKSKNGICTIELVDIDIESVDIICSKNKEYTKRRPLL